MWSYIDIFLFFFFQAEDGIRDLTVTGVQTCALPILSTADRQHFPGDVAGAARRRHEHESGGDLLGLGGSFHGGTAAPPGGLLGLFVVRIWRALNRAVRRSRYSHFPSRQMPRFPTG